MPHASINVVDRPAKIKPDMLVVHKGVGNIGIVTQVTRKWVHVTWLINKVTGTTNYHYANLYKRADLEVCPVGTRLTVKQV